MNSTTAKVIAMKSLAKNSDTWNELFGDVYLDLHHGMTQCVESYRNGLRGDIQEGLSVANECLIHAIERFKYTGFEFSSYFSRVLKNKLTDVVRFYNTGKMRTYFDGSMDASFHVGDGEEREAQYQSVPESLRTVDTYSPFQGHSITDVLEDFRKVTKDAVVIEIIFDYSLGECSKSDMTSKLAQHFGSETYTPAIQRRVSRIRASFRRFAEDSGLGV